MSLEALQKRIKTTQDLRDIVSTMKSLSSVSILQYEQANKSLKEYKSILKDGIHALIRTGKLKLPPTPKNLEQQKTLAIIIGSDNGLVGRFNKELIDFAKKTLSSEGHNISDCAFISIGKRIASIAENQKLNLKAKYAVSNSIKVVGSIASTVIMRIEEAIRNEHFSRVIVFYHKQNATSSSVKSKVLLPFSTDAYARLSKEPWATNNIPLITMPPQKLTSVLVQEILMTVLSSAITSSLAAEHRTRMINMQNAEKNIDENLEKLNHIYQQERQEDITDELIDVISGSEAIHKSKKRA